LCSAYSYLCPGTAAESVPVDGIWAIVLRSETTNLQQTNNRHCECPRRMAWVVLMFAGCLVVPTSQ
jgi:hypothetical protein